ncbi:MAG: Uma2 family endonuclease [Isosphaeraceae bacterium]
MSVETGETATGTNDRVGRLYRLRVGQYPRMAEAGICSGDDSVELLEGLLVTKMNKNPPHIITTELVQLALVQAVPGGWCVSMQNPVSLFASDSEPEPDAKIVRGHPRDYQGRKPGPEDVALVVEVADASYLDDLEKRRTYANAAIPVYWILNLNRRRLEVHTDPTGPSPLPLYRTVQTFGPDVEISLWLDGREAARILVGDLLP